MVRLIANRSIRREMCHFAQASALGAASACVLYTTTTIMGLSLSAICLSGATALVMLSALVSQPA